MAALNFFDGFNATWAQDGSIRGWTAEQYKTGWAVIGDTKPSVEDFNNTHQIIDQKANYLYRQLKTAAQDRSVTTAANKDDTLLELLNKQRDELLSAVYPVGAIYINASNATDPNTFLPGTWEKITQGFLYPHGATQAGSVGSTGGNASIKLSVAQLPAHNHSMGSAGSHSHTGTAASSGTHSHSAGTSSAGAHTHTVPGGAGRIGVTGGAERFAASETTGATSSAGGHTHSVTVGNAGAHTHNVSTNSTGAHTHTIANTGSGASINIMPPKLTVYMWKRTA